MTLVRWDPIRDLLSMHQRLSASTPGSQDAYGPWAPPVDIFERGDDLVIHAEIPGVERDAISIQVEDNRLILQGERKRDDAFREEGAFRLERAFGSFTRSFQLPRTVDASKIGATYKNGVLEVRLPKAEQAKPRRISIEAV